MNRTGTRRSTLPLLAGVLGLGLALALAPGRAHAQYNPTDSTSTNDIGSDSTNVPNHGFGVSGSLLVPIGLYGQTPSASRVLPLGYLIMGDYRLRFADRLMFRLGIGGGNVGWYNGSSIAIPLDVGLRVDVIPIEGPFALWIGAVGRAAALIWSPSSMTTDFAYSVSVAPELALEFTSQRRHGFEFFARYNFGLLNSATGSAASPFGASDQMTGLEIGLAAHLYL